MRVNPNLYANVNSSIAASEQAVQTAVDQLSSGKRVSLPSDDPTAFTANLRSVATAATVDRYSKNAEAVLTQAQAADSALSSVITSLTQAVTLGTQGGNGTLTTSQRAVTQQQVQSLLATVVSQANQSFGGSSLFGGTASTVTPFVADATSPTGYTYQGNSGVNQARVGDQLTVSTNTPGDQIFDNPTGSVLGSLQQLGSALQSGSSIDIAAATSAVSAAITQVSTARANFASTITQINDQEHYLSQETISLTSQQTSLTNIDLAKAATNMTQAQTAHSAVLAVAAKILPMSLMDYLK